MFCGSFRDVSKANGSAQVKPQGFELPDRLIELPDDSWQKAFLDRVTIR